METDDLSMSGGGFSLASLRDKATVFSLLAFVPLPILVYFNVWGVIIPIFGFMLLHLRKGDLPFNRKTHIVQRLFGLVVMIGSFFLYFLWVPYFFSYMVFYNVTNYVAYVFGLCVGFFGLQSLRQVFTPLFVMVAASLNPFISRWMEMHTASYVVPAVTGITLASLNFLRIPAIRSGPNVITLQFSNGQLLVPIIWNCVGVNMILVFTIALVVMLFEDSSSTRTRLVWSVFGVIGTIVINLIRITLIFVTDYLYGAEAGGFVHFSIGYIFLFVWLGLFLSLFSKGAAIATKLRALARAPRR